MFTTYLDCMPLADTKYIVCVWDKTDNCISLVGTDDIHSLDYRGLNDLTKIYPSDSVTVYDSDGNECLLTRIK